LKKRSLELSILARSRGRRLRLSWAGSARNEIPGPLPWHSFRRWLRPDGKVLIQTAHAPNIAGQAFLNTLEARAFGFTIFDRISNGCAKNQDPDEKPDRFHRVR
jgi:hypothetical protein